MNKYLITKSLNLQTQLKKKWAKYIILKTFNYNENNLLKQKLKIMLKFQLFYNNPFKSKIFTRCLFSGYTRSTINVIQGSKSMFKVLHKQSILYGFKKSSW